MDADPDPEPDLDNYPYRVKVAYKAITDDIGGLLNNRERLMIAETLYAMYTGLADDLY